MKIKFTLLPVLLLLSLLLSACSDTSPSTQNTSDNINTESTITDDTTSVSEPDLFEAVRQSKEDWLSYGLSAYESQKETVNLKDFFSNPANMTYLTLYDDMFAFDKAKSIPVAEALFKFICDEYGVDALLDTEKRIDYKTAYLK